MGSTNLIVRVTYLSFIYLFFHKDCRELDGSFRMKSGNWLETLTELDPNFLAVIHPSSTDKKKKSFFKPTTCDFGS